MGYWGSIIFEPPVYAYRHVYRSLDERHEDAEEVTQDTFLGAISLAETYDGSCSVLTWLCGIARLRIADFLRKEGRQKRIPTDRMVSLDEQETDLLRRADRDAEDVEGILGRLWTSGPLQPRRPGPAGRRWR